MLPGMSTKLSEEVLASGATIAPSKDLVVLTGSTALVNIVPPRNGGFSTFLMLVPRDGAINTTAAGNIGTVFAMAQNRVHLFVYSKIHNKWYAASGIA